MTDTGQVMKLRRNDSWMRITQRLNLAGSTPQYGIVPRLVQNSAPCATMLKARRRYETIKA